MELRRNTVQGKKLPRRIYSDKNDSRLVRFPNLTDGACTISLAKPSQILSITNLFGYYRSSSELNPGTVSSDYS